MGAHYTRRQLNVHALADRTLRVSYDKEGTGKLGSKKGAKSPKGVYKKAKTKRKEIEEKEQYKLKKGKKKHKGSKREKKSGKKLNTKKEKGGGYVDYPYPDTPSRSKQEDDVESPIETATPTSAPTCLECDDVPIVAGSSQFDQTGQVPLTSTQSGSTRRSAEGALVIANLCLLLFWRRLY